MERLPVYLDYNATTPCDPNVVEAMLPWFTRHFGNASSKTHAYGLEAEDAVSEARSGVLKLSGAAKGKVIFTSGATEAVNLAIKGIAQKPSNSRRHIVSFATEHRAVLDTLHQLEKSGFDVTLLKTNADGVADSEAVEEAKGPETFLVSMMFANNETGVIQPVDKVASICRKNDVLFFCDATQAMGKTPVEMDKHGIDLLACSAHKMYGPKGVGALVLGAGELLDRLQPQTHGGGHELGLRSGTLNVPGIVGMGKACSIAFEGLSAESYRIESLRNRFLVEMLALPGTKLNGNRSRLLPHVANIRYTKPGGDTLLRRLAPAVAAASGSACSSAITRPSHVLKAMGLSDADAYSSIRFSLGRFTTETEIEFALQALRERYPIRGNS